VGGHVTLPLVLTLLGHEAGAKPGDGKGQKDDLRKALAAPVEPEVAWLRRVLRPRPWSELWHAVGKAQDGPEQSAPGNASLTYLELELAASWLAPVSFAAAQAAPGADEEEAQGSEEWGACCEGVVMVRGPALFADDRFAQLPASAQRALRSEHASSASEEADREGQGGQMEQLRALVAEAVGSRLVGYESRVLGFGCLTSTIVSKVQHLQDALVLDLSSMRGWHDGAGGGLERHRRVGLLRVSVDPLTIRQRAHTAAKRAEIMGWWLLLKEEMARTRGLTGLSSGGGQMEQSVLLRRVVSDPFFLDMQGYSSLGASTGILDDDGFQCPSVGNPCVSGLGISLDSSAFSLSVLRALLALLSAHYPLGHPMTDSGGGPQSIPNGEGLGAPASFLVVKEEQTALYERFLALAARPVAQVGRHLPPQPGLEVLYALEAGHWRLATLVPAMLDAADAAVDSFKACSWFDFLVLPGPCSFLVLAGVRRAPARARRGSDRGRVQRLDGCPVEHLCH